MEDILLFSIFFVYLQKQENKFMDEREKELKKQDDKKFVMALCLYLPYDVKVSHSMVSGIVTAQSKFVDRPLSSVDTVYNTFSTCENGASVVGMDIFNRLGDVRVKPYLRSMKTMTEDEKNELYKILKEETDIVIEQLKTGDCGIPEGKYHFNSQLQLDFCLRHKFDMFGLIPKGYALEAPEGMYK
jgi:hypothetical protein